MITFLADNSVYLVMGIVAAFGAIEVLAGLLDHSKRRMDDYILENASALGLLVVIKPGIIFLVTWLGAIIYPAGGQLLTGYHIGWLVLGYLLVDDLLQYWYHRSAHEHPGLWKLHLPHHTAEEMGLLVSYRNTGLYYMLMPNIWWMAVATFMGGGMAVAIGLVLKQLIIIGSHSPTKWDRVLYRYKFLAPITFIIQRIIITPAFHYAHHGKSQADGISDPNGNYGNMFSIWDQLFGTATFNNTYPTELGLPKDPKDSWMPSFFYPFIGSMKTHSELSKDHQKTRTPLKDAVTVELEPGKHLWCSCGYSTNQPFCDGSHHGSKNKPLLLEVEKPRKAKLCACKLTKSPPYCDNSHTTLL